MSASDEGVRVLRLRYAAVCGCGTSVPAGTRAGWIPGEKRVLCPGCLDGEAGAVEASGATETSTVAESGGRQGTAGGGAGASLQAEYERRMAKREARVLGRFPRVGRLLLEVFDEAPSTRAFKSGAEGERKAVKRILSDTGDDVLLLVNRRLGVGRRDGDIDIIAVTAAGVHVIDVKRYKGAKVSVERTGGLLSPRVEHLRVRGRESSHLLDGVEKQVNAVRQSLVAADAPAEVSVMAALCFVEAELPLIQTPVARGIRCLGSKGTARWLRDATGPHDQEARQALFDLLDQAHPPASTR